MSKQNGMSLEYIECLIFFFMDTLDMVPYDIS